MPYKVATDVEGCSGYAVIKPETGELVACHRTKSDAARHVRALYANVPDAVKKATTESLMVLHDKIHNLEMDAGALATHHYLSTELARRGLDLSMEDEFSHEVIIDPELTLDGVELEELFGGEEELIEDLVTKWEENEVDVFKVAFALWGDGMEILVKEQIKENVDKVAESDTFTPPASVAREAKRALQWIREGKAGGGFTDVGRARAAQLAGRRPVSLRTIKRMRSYFARHTPDKKAEGFTRGEKDYPSGGRVAWDAWGGDAGESWVKGILRSVEAQENMSKHQQGKHDQKSHNPGKYARGIGDQINAGEHPSVKSEDIGALFTGFSKLEDHPDLTELKVEGTMLFGDEGMGIARKDMPQVPSERRDEFLSDLSKAGTKTTKESIDPKTLKPIQKEVSASRSGAIYMRYKESGNIPDEQRILVSSDGYVIDGHHTWGAAVALSYDSADSKLPIYRINLTAKEALAEANKWADSKGIGRQAIDAPAQKSLAYEEPFIKAEERKFTLGPLYIPNKLDAHKEWTDEEELQSAIWNYVKSGDRRIRLQHNRDVEAGEWVELMTFPYPLTVPMTKANGETTEISYPANTVFMGVVWKDWAWELVKQGKLRGYSIGGKAQRIGVDLPMDAEKGDPGVNAVHVDTIMKPPKKIKKAKDISVGDVVLYAVRKPDQTTYATGKVERVERSGTVKLRGTQESEKATAENPVAVIRVWAETEDGYTETDRQVLKPFSALRMTDKEIVEKAVEDTLREKAKEHNDAVGDNKSKRTTASTLLQVYRRGVGAYETNPSSVRPTVTGREQWAYGRVNGFLHALRTGKFKRGAYDTDLLPDSHPLASKEKK
jgi:hypothetical protein